MHSETRLKHYSTMVDTELERVIADRDLPLYSMMRYHLGWLDSDETPTAAAGPRNLGALCLSSSVSLGGSADPALPTAAAIELVQNFCEIHDDIQSGKVGRNDRDSVWWKWGPAQAINAGDGMHALARLALFGLRDHGVEPDRVFEAVKLLDNAGLETCEGRFVDLEAQERLDITSDAYLKMASAKSGSLYACAMEFGALVSDSDSEARSAMSSSGRSLGVAVQIAEDLRQLTSTMDEQSPPSDDFMNKKKLYPVVRAFEMASASERRALGDHYFKRVLEPSDVRSISAIVNDLGAFDESRAMIELKLSEACETVANVAGTDSEVEDIMRLLAGVE